MLKIKVDKKNIFFWIAYFLGVASAVLSGANIRVNVLLSIMKLLMTGLIILGFLLSQHFSIKSFVKLVILTAITIITYFYNGADVFVYSILLLVLASNIYVEKIAKAYLWVTVVSTAVVMLLSFVGVSQLAMSAKGQIVYCFGFTTANTFAIITLKILLAVICAYYDKIRFRHILLLAMLCFLINCITASRTSFYASIVAIVLLLYAKYYRISFESKMSMVIISILPFIFVGLSILASSWYRNGAALGVLFNTLLSNRLYYANYYLQKYNFTIFGNTLETVSSYTARTLNVGWLGLDNSYLYAILGYGAIICIIIMILYCCGARTAWAEKKKGLIIAIIVFGIYGVTENGWSNCWLNFTWFASTTFFGLKRKVE